jgi:hypothetical protein
MDQRLREFAAAAKKKSGPAPAKPKQKRTRRRPKKPVQEAETHLVPARTREENLRFLRSCGISKEDVAVFGGLDKAATMARRMRGLAEAKTCKFCSASPTKMVLAQPMGMPVCDAHVEDGKALAKKITGSPVEVKLIEDTTSGDIATVPVPLGSKIVPAMVSVDDLKKKKKKRRKGLMARLADVDEPASIEPGPLLRQVFPTG